jgi:hypothetical protein
MSGMSSGLPSSEPLAEATKTASLESFQKCLIVLCDTIKKGFSDCIKTQALLPVLIMMTKNSPASVIDTWHDMMNETSKAGYWRAFKRLTSRDLCFYDVARYKDMTALLTHQTFCDMFNIDMVSKYRAATEEWQINFQKSIMYLNSSSFWYHNGSDLRHVPTSAEIKNNIDQCKKVQTAGEAGKALAPAMPSTVGAPRERVGHDPLKKKELLHQIFSTLKHTFESGGEAYETFLQSIDKCSVEEIDSFFSDVAAADASRHADSGDFLALVSIETPLFAASKLRESCRDVAEEVKVSFCKEFSQLVTFTNMTSKIPPSLVNTIENKANELSSQISDEDGNVDLSKIDLTKMSQSIMQDIDPKDLTAMMTNVSSILPDVIKLSQSMPQGAMGGGANGDQLAQMMSALSGLGRK